MNTPDARLVDFVRYLRVEGYVIGIRETIDALKTLNDAPWPDVRLARNVIRSLACRDYNSWQRFDGLFTGYWFPDLAPAHNKDVAALVNPRQKRQRQAGITGLSGASMEETVSSADKSNTLGIGAGRQKTISRADFRFLNDRSAMREVENLAERLATTFRQRLRYRRVMQSRGRHIDMRRTLRRNLSLGGMPVRPIYSERRLDPPHIVILHDVSHSMAWNNPLLFRFARGLVRTFPKSEAFAFHTRLFRVTELYRERSLKIMKERLESRDHMWFGGTCIADSLQHFNRRYANRVIHPHSIIIVLSDGFDTNDPDYLARELGFLRARTKKIIWLNPMLGRKEYVADTETMKAVLPHVDYFAPAHSLMSLGDAVQYIARHCH